MEIRFAQEQDIQSIVQFDKHIPLHRLEICIDNRQVYVVQESGFIIGALRYSLFWQTIPFLDLIYLHKNHRNKGYGTKMMNFWEDGMRKLGYKYVMTSTQSDETSYQFYEKLGYKKAGDFLPPQQKVSELIYLKKM